MNNCLRLYNDFVHTLDHCGTFLLNRCDDEIEYHLFEEFSIDCISFLHQKSLDVLLSIGMINNEIFEKCLKLRTMYLAIEREHPEKMNVKSVREDVKWLEIFYLSDSIHSMLYYNI